MLGSHLRLWRGVWIREYTTTSLSPSIWLASNNNKPAVHVSNLAITAPKLFGLYSTFIPVSVPSLQPAACLSPNWLQ